MNCINVEWKYDGEYDCTDGSDEITSIGCDYSKCKYVTVPNIGDSLIRIMLLLWNAYWYQICFKGISYERQNSNHCANTKYEEYSTLSIAQSACDSDSNCRGVYDGDCDNSGSFNLCLISAGLEASSSGSCVYEKTSGS